MNRTEKLQLLDNIFNQGSKETLKSLTRPIYPKIIIYEPRSGGLVFSGQSNPTLPKIYQDVILDDTQLGTMLVAGGNGTTFLLPDNFRD